MRLPLTAIAAAAAVAGLCLGCGGDGGEENLADEEELRVCLADAGFGIQAPDISASAGLGSASADFRAVTPEGVAAEIVVLGSARKAERTAADIAAARATFGGGGGDVVQGRNAIAAFDGEASDEAREAVEGCLG